MKKLKIISMDETSDDLFNVYPAEEFIPEWYRLSHSRLPGTNSEILFDSPGSLTSTYKKCTPFLDAMSSGYIIALSADVEVALTPDGSPNIQWRTQRQLVRGHTNEQWDGLPCPDGYVPYLYKWNNTFTINAPNGYSLLFTTPLNRFDLPFECISGVVDTDLYKLPVSFPFFIKKGFTGIIKKGTPLVQIIPIKRDGWQREYFNFDKKFYITEAEKFLSTIKRSYKNNFWNRKKYE